MRPWAQNPPPHRLCCDRRGFLRGGWRSVQALAWSAGGRVAAGAAGGSLAMMAGCGFKLRGTAALGFSRLHLVGAVPQTSLGQQMRLQLAGIVQLVDQPSQAQVVLRLETAQRERLVTGLTSSGLVRELVLRLRLRFSLATPQGRVLIDGTDLVLQRDMSTNESAALAKAREEEEIFRVLERDAVLQIVRRLEAVVVPDGAAPVAAPSTSTVPARP